MRPGGSMATRSDNLPRRFARLYTAAITDVMDEMGLLRQTLPHAIQPLAADMRVAGYAFTARGRPQTTAETTPRSWLNHRSIVLPRYQGCGARTWVTEFCQDIGDTFFRGPPTHRSIGGCHGRNCPS